MAQRWMQSKLALARTHGLARSGAGRAMGDVWEDRMIGRVDLSVKGEITKQVRNVILKTTAERQRYDATAPAWKRPRGYVAR